MRKETGLALLIGGLALGSICELSYQNRNKESLNLGDYAHIGLCLTAATAIYLKSQKENKKIYC